MGEQMKKGVASSLIKALGCTVVASVYAGACWFFQDSFYYTTLLSDLNISGKTVEAAKMAVNQKGENFEITLYGRGVKKERLQGKTFELNYSIKEDLAELKGEQNALAWPLGLIKKDKLKVTEEVSFNEALLDVAISELAYFDEDRIEEPVDASIVFNGTEFEIVPEEEGNKLNLEAVKLAIVEALHNSKRVIDLEESGCYEEPQLRSDSEELIETRDLLNQYIKSQITYVFGSKEEVVTPQEMSTWIDGVDENGELIVNEDEIRSYLNELDKKYSTLGRTRKFKDSYGNMSTVSGGDFGWQLSMTQEINAIVEALKTGESIHREPIATSTSQPYKENEISGSYVEINLTSQYMWFYKDGKVLASGSVVTGDQNRGYSTPQGVYTLTYKQRNATLTGPGYSTPVSFWMPFNGNIGIHDATWRGSFGGTIYQYDGSHGCVNAPYNLAKTIFNHIDKTMPIVCYY